LKITDGLFHKIFDEIAAEYPELTSEFWIVDIGAAKLADTPEAFDVLVLPNLYGDILSDVAAQIAGSVGLAGSANIGDVAAMFEAIHGSAPRRANQNLANPSGLLQGAILMLAHIGQTDVANRVQNAWLRTIEDGIHTYDIYKEGTSKEKVGTREFALAVIARLGQTPQHLRPASYRPAGSTKVVAAKTAAASPERKALVGVDVYLDWTGGTPEDLGARLQSLSKDRMKLQAVFNRGTVVWPNGIPETFCTDHWRARYLGSDGATLDHRDIIELLERIGKAGYDYIKTEHLYTFDGIPGYSAGPA
jgi:isocitrate dehydrogenase